MLDIALFLFIVAFLVAGVRRPFLWVLAYLYVDILAPQKIGWALMPAIKISLIAFCAAFAGWLLADPKRGARFSLRQAIMVALLAYCWFTTMNADFPEAAAEKWAWVWKAFVFAIFLPLTLTTRLRIESAGLIMILAVSAIIISAGMKTVTGGGGYENLYFFVNDNSGIYESSTLATVAIAIIPLILWFTRHGTIFPPDWRVRLFAYALIFACLMIPIGTEARTGLVCVAVLAVLMLREAKRRLAFIAAGVALAVMALPFIPQSYYDRMATIGSHDGDESASTRVAVWEWTLDYVKENPLGGGFDAFRGNSFTYDLPERVESGNTVAIDYRKVTDKGRAYHSSIFEVLGEQGYIGLGLWTWLHLLGLWHMERIRHRWHKRIGDGEQWQAPLASALQYGQAIYLVGSLFQGIAYQPFILMLLGLQIGLWTYCRRLESERNRASRKKPHGHGEVVSSPHSGDAVTAKAPALR